jgi:hypothetical protein
MCPALLAVIRSLYPACPGAPSHAERSAGRPRKLKKGDAVRVRILRDPAMGLVLAAWAVATSIESHSTSDRADLCMYWANPGANWLYKAPTVGARPLPEDGRRCVVAILAAVCKRPRHVTAKSVGCDHHPGPCPPPPPGTVLLDGGHHPLRYLRFRPRNASEKLLDGSSSTSR